MVTVNNNIPQHTKSKIEYPDEYWYFDEEHFVEYESPCREPVIVMSDATGEQAEALKQFVREEELARIKEAGLWESPTADELNRIIKGGYMTCPKGIKIYRVPKVVIKPMFN